jgi:hypothetical protein
MSTRLTRSTIRIADATRARRSAAVAVLADEALLVATLCNGGA